MRPIDNTMRRMKQTGAALAALVVLGAAAGGTAPGVGQPALATVGGVEITDEAFRTRYVDYLLRTGVPDAPRLRAAFLDQMVADRLLALAARAAGVEEEAGYRHRREVVARKLLLDYHLEQAVYDTVHVSEADLTAMFARINTTLTARHLYARTREAADRLYARLQAGEAFEALAREVFADTALANHGGSVGTFGFDEMDPAFEDAAYALKVGEVSPPVRTAQGYSIIQLEDRFTNPLLTEQEFAQRRRNLEAYVLRRKRQAARSAYLQGLADALDVRFEAAALDRLLGQVTGERLQGDGESNDWLAAPLLSFVVDGRRQAWTVETFRERAQYTEADQRAQVRARQDLVDFARGLVVRETLLARAHADGLDARPVFAAALQQTMDEWTVEQAKARLSASVDVPEDSARAFFETHRAAFVVPAKVRVREIMTETKAEAEALRAQLGAAPFEALARAHSVRPGADATGGDLGYLTEEALGTLGRPVFDAAEGAVLGPLEVAGRYVLLQVGPRQAARPMTFEEARGSLYPQLQRAAADVQLQAYVRQLRARYDVTIDRERLAALALGPSRAR